SASVFCWSKPSTWRPWCRMKPSQAARSPCQRHTCPAEWTHVSRSPLGLRLSTVGYKWSTWRNMAGKATHESLEMEMEEAGVVVSCCRYIVLGEFPLLGVIGRPDLAKKQLPQDCWRRGRTSVLCRAHVCILTYALVHARVCVMPVREQVFPVLGVESACNPGLSFDLGAASVSLGNNVML
ncbi:unnamed protein product, partial [Ectocarpus sp. 12 AP-2014]